MNELFEDIRKKFPFMALIQVGAFEYVGIVANQNQQVTSIYDYSKLKSEQEKKEFLKGAEIAYETILTSFANGDNQKLKSLTLGSREIEI